VKDPERPFRLRSSVILRLHKRGERPKMAFVRARSNH
jgi:hypothetical protein